jgi:SAM-dependent methyltransferase
MDSAPVAKAATGLWGLKRQGGANLGAIARVNIHSDAPKASSRISHMPSPAEWYQTLFTGLFVEAQRRIPWPTAAEADFIVDVLQPRAGARLLDVPCGTGRLTIPLAERGFQLTGVDLCDEVLTDGRRAAAEQNLPAAFERRDMRDLPWRGEFDGAFCFGNSFAYLGEAGDRAFLAAVFAALKPGGRFVLNTGLCAEGVFTNRLQRAWFPMGDLLFLVDTAYDPAAATLTSSYTVVQGGRTERQQAVYHIYTYRQLVGMFQDAGFANVRGFGSLKQEPFVLGSPSLFLVATKP